MSAWGARPQTVALQIILSDTPYRIIASHALLHAFGMPLTNLVISSGGKVLSDDAGHSGCGANDHEIQKGIGDVAYRH
jgi:hypothetical protein